MMSCSWYDDPKPATALPSTTNTEEDEDDDDDDDEDDSWSLYPAPTADYLQIVNDSHLFFQSLEGFHSSFRTLYSVPTVSGKPLDLHRLFVEVTSRGGLEKVIRDRKWKEVVMTFNFPSPITNGSFAFRKHYLSLLYHFEQVYYFRKQVPPGPPTPPSPESPASKLGCAISGTIDGKFDSGYLVTMTLDSENLTGVLYHIPDITHMSQCTNTSVVPRPRNQNRSRMEVRDHSLNKLNMGYNFSFTEQYT